MTPSQRHNCMSHIRGKDTKPEIKVRQWLWRHGYRYRLNVKDIPGKPDIVMRKYNTVIFINGCFWHGHEGCPKFVIPKSNIEFWESKIRRNQERDRKNYELLRGQGWQVIVIWECRLSLSSIEQTMTEAERLILGKCAARYRCDGEKTVVFAAEPNVEYVPKSKKT